MRLLHTERTFLNMAGKYSSQTVRLVAHMDGAVDEELLKEAVEATRQRYPYLCVRLCIVHDEQGAERYAYEDNPQPWVLTQGEQQVALLGEASNNHLIAFCWWDDCIALDFFYSLADGTSAYRVLRTLLYEYCRRRYDSSLSAEGIMVAGETIDEGEYTDPATLPRPEKFIPQPKMEHSQTLNLSAAALALSAVIAVFVLLLGLAWIIRGRIFLPKFTKRFAGWAHGFFDTGIAALYGYVYLLSEVLKGKDDGSSAALSVMAYVALGAQVVIAILIGITYRMAFKNRVYEKKEKKKDEEEAYINKPVQPGQPQKQGKVPIYEKDVPQYIRTVGDHAYAGDPALTRANIPEGVTVLGSNAFANCRNLEIVTIPVTVTKIGSNCFYNTPHLKQIRYTGSKEDWRSIKRGGNWLVGAGTTTIITANGAIVVNPNQ